VGRERELEELAHYLADPSIRLITVLGPGGIGKTHLALATAEAQLSNFDDGNFFIPLASVSSQEDVVPALAEAVGFRFFEGDDPREQLLNYLKENHILLVIDNCEHLLLDDGASGLPGLISEIILTAPGVKLLATSREKLNLIEEKLYRLKGLEFPSTPGSITADEAQQYSAIQLFTQGARQVSAGYTLAEADLDHIIQICEMVGGLPLGLLLSAAWVEIFSPGEISAEIQRNLDFLVSDLRGLPARHRSMRAVFDSAWNQLSETQCSAFMKLAVFRGGFNRAAAQAVGGADLWMLIDLVNKSLLYHDPKSGRYQIHELLRQYAEGKLEERVLSDSAQRAHCAYFSKFMAHRASDLRGKRTLEAVAEIEVDYENIRSAWRWAVRQRDTQAISQMIDGLEFFSYMQDRFYEGEELLRGARLQLTPTNGEAPRPVWTRIIFSWYILNFMSRGRLKNYEEITAQANLCLEGAQQRDDHYGIALSQFLLGIIALHRRAYYQALQYFESSLESDPTLNNEYSIDADIGLCYRALGQLDRATACFQQVLDSARANKDEPNAGWALNNMGEIAMIAGEPQKAKRCWEEARVLLRESSDLMGIMWNLANLSMIRLFEGNLPQAKRMAEEVLQMAMDVHHIYSMREALVMLGHVAVANGDYTGGRIRLQSALEIDPVTLDAHLGMSLAECGLGEYKLARVSLGKALKFEAALGVPAMIALYLPAAALILAGEGEAVLAIELLSRAFDPKVGLVGLLESWALIAQLQSDIRSEVGDDNFQGAWQRGQALEYNAALDIITERFGLPAEDQPVEFQPQLPIKNQPLVEPLSRRELQILRLLKSELSGPEIAAELMISVNTFRYHTKNIYGKLNVNSRRAAVRRADELGL
jgi:predicted ATPase/DNA-binding CsgD family transcriptional regulator/Tfp pilus assembly protein PilF